MKFGGLDISGTARPIPSGIHNQNTRYLEKRESEIFHPALVRFF